MSSKFKFFVISHHKFINDNIQYKGNYNNFIGELLYLYSKYSNDENITNYKNVVNNILIVCNEIFNINIKPLKEVNKIIINRYKFLINLSIICI